MKLRLSCADFAFPLISHEAALDLIAAIGFQGVDIGLFQDRSHLQPSDQFMDISGSAARLRTSLNQRGLSAADVFVQADLDFTVYAVNHPDPSRRLHARTLFLQALEYAALLGSEHVSGLPGVAFPEEPLADSLARCAQENAWRAAEAAKAGIRYGVEAHIGSIIEHPSAALQLAEAVPGLGLTLDYSHFVRQGLPDTVGDPLIPHASHMHARGAANGILQTSVAENEIGFERIMGLLKRQGFDGWICLEYCWTPEWENCSRNDNLSETVILRDRLIRSFDSLHS